MSSKVILLEPLKFLKTVLRKSHPFELYFSSRVIRDEVSLIWVMNIFPVKNGYFSAETRHIVGFGFTESVLAKRCDTLDAKCDYQMLKNHC